MDRSSTREPTVSKGDALSIDKAAGPADDGNLETLFLLYQAGDRNAAAAFIAQISGKVFSYMLANTRDRQQAEDLLQDFWLRVHKARRTYRPGEPVLPWIYAIARRVKTDDYRRRNRIASHEVQTGEPPERGSIDGHPARSYMANLLNQLPASQREAVLLLKVNGLTLEEAARATGSTVGAVKQRAHRAFGTLRKFFGSSS